MILAVDDNNAPALHLYRSLGFSVSTRKRALIHNLPRSAD